MHVVEYHYRGLPHAHIVYRIYDLPDKVFGETLITLLGVNLLTKLDLLMDLLLIMVLSIYQIFQLQGQVKV